MMRPPIELQEWLKWEVFLVAVEQVFKGYVLRERKGVK